VLQTDDDAGRDVSPGARLFTWLRPRDNEPVFGPLAAARHIEALVTEHHGPETLRAFTIRITKRMPDTDIASLIGLAKRHGWYGFGGNAETDQYDTLIFINEAAP
jgi:hypothetical protein